jgi:hypothetical protein
MPREINAFDQKWEEKQLDKIDEFLNLFYVDLRAGAKNPESADKLKACGLGYVYWAALKEIKTLTMSGERRAQVAYWGGPPPTRDTSLDLLNRVRLNWANTKQRRRDLEKAGVSKERKLIPVVARKQHNPGTVFVALSGMYKRQPVPGYAASEIAEWAVQQEFPATLCESLVALGFMEEVSGHYVFTQEPTQELADVLHDELFGTRKRGRAEMYNDLGRCLVQIHDLFHSGPVDSSTVNRVLERYKFKNDTASNIRSACLDRVPTGLRGVVHYIWRAGVKPGMELAALIYNKDQKKPEPARDARHEEAASAVPPQAEQKKEPGGNPVSFIPGKLEELRRRREALLAELGSVDSDIVSLERAIEILGIQ